MDYEKLTISELNLLIEELSIIKDKKLKETGFPYIEIFKLSTNAGEEIEKLLCKEVFPDLIRVRGKNYDQITSGKKYIIETKLIRMMTQGSGDYNQKAISILDKNKGYKSKSKKYGGKISTTTFQQIKPQEFDFLLGVLLFKDGFDIFILPSYKICKKVKTKEKERAYLSGQHKGNHNEGQLNYNDVVLNNNYYFSVYNDGKNLFYFDRVSKKILKTYNKTSLENLIHEKLCIEKHCE